MNSSRPSECAATGASKFNFMVNFLLFPYHDSEKFWVLPHFSDYSSYSAPWKRWLESTVSSRRFYCWLEIYQNLNFALQGLQNARFSWFETVMIFLRNRSAEEALETNKQYRITSSVDVKVWILLYYFHLYWMFSKWDPKIVQDVIMYIATL